MDKATTGAILGTILGLLAGVGGMYFLGPARDGADLDAESKARIARLESDYNTLKGENDGLKAKTEQADKDRKSAAEIAGDVDRLAGEKGEVAKRAADLKNELDLLKNSSAEDARQKNALIDDLKAKLIKLGDLSFLPPEEIQKRLEKNKTDFEAAFANKSKKGVMDALWDAQKLGPVAFDAAIEMWRQAAADFGLNPFGQGPGTLGMNMQEYVSLISNFGMIQKGLTDANAPMDFKIASLYSLPWWSSEGAAERAKLAGDALKVAKGYEAFAAVEALRDIQDPGTERYLSEFLAGNTDNGDARVNAVNALARKNTPNGWSSIENAAKNDPDEKVRKAAQRQLATRDAGVEGVMITWVGADSQGALAGIKIGDILTSYNGVRIKTLEDVNNAKQDVAEGQTVTVVVRRGSEDINLQLGPGQIGINGTVVAPKR